MLRFPKRFTEEELATSAAANGAYDTITWEQLFHRIHGDARLAAEIHREDPVTYARLKAQWHYAERQPTPEQQLRTVRNSPLD